MADTMTGTDLPASDSSSPLDDFRALLEDIEPNKFTPHAEPLAWRYRCGSRMSSTTDPGAAPMADVIASLVNAARSHAATCYS